MQASSMTIDQKIIQLALPMAGTQFITMGSTFLCMLMLATFGHEVLAASALIYAISISLSVTGFAILFSLCILVGHAYGAKDYLSIGSLTQQAWLLSLVLSIPVMIILWNIYPILIYFGQDPTISKIVTEGLQASTWRIVPLYLAVCNQQLCYGVHKQKIDMLANTLGMLVQLIAAYILILGKFGFSSLGAAGFGYASAAQAWFYFIFTTVCLLRMKAFASFQLFRWRLHQHWSHLVNIFKVGWPICVQIGGELLSFIVFSIFIGWLGSNALAATQIVSQYQFLVIVPFFALSQAGGILIGQAYGSKQFADIKKIGTGCIKISIMVSIIIAIVFICLPKPLASLYIDIHDPANATVLQLSILLFFVLAINQIIDALRHVLIGALRGLLDSRYPMIVGLLGIWLAGVPIGYLLAFPLELGVVGVMIGGTIGLLIGMVILIFRWQKLCEQYA